MIEQAVIQVAEKHVTWTRRVTHQLRRGDSPVHINRKQVQRITREHDLLRPVKRRKKHTTQSDHGYGRYPNLIKDMDAVYPNHIWVADITYICFSNGFIYLATALTKSSLCIVKRAMKR